jgi:hypothetical protein
MPKKQFVEYDTSVPAQNDNAAELKRMRGLPLLEFIPVLSPEFISPIHLAEWCELIESVLDGGVRGLCEVPVRHNKSETSYHGIAWLLMRDPTLRILIMFANIDLARERANRIKQLCTAAGIGPTSGTAVTMSWQNEHGGGVTAMSAQQSKLGLNVDLLMFDDPMSEHDIGDKSIRDDVDRAISHYTMRAGRPGRRGSVLGIMSRWHPDDPMGRRFARRAAEWKRIHHAAITYHDPQTGVIVDEGTPGCVEKAYAPHVMDLTELHKRREEEKERDPSEGIWYAQFQNDPRPDRLGLFKKPRRYRELPSGGAFRTVFGVDLAYSMEKFSDYFALVVLKIWPEIVIDPASGRPVTREVAYVCRSWREKWDPAGAISTIKAAKLQFPGAKIYSYMSGPEKGMLNYMGEHGINIDYIPARTHKRVRAQRTIDISNEGRIVFPEDEAANPWVRGQLARLEIFSGDEKGGDDDDIDALVSAIDGGMWSMGAAPRSLGKSRTGLVVR